MIRNFIPGIIWGGLLLAAAGAHSQGSTPGYFWGSVLASENERYLREWTATPPSHPARLPRQGAVSVGHRLHVSFVTSRFTVLDDSMNVALDVSIVRPDGKDLMRTDDWFRLNVPIETNETFVMAPQVLELKFDASDPKGTYRIIGTFRDLLSGTRRVTDTLKVDLK